MTSAWLRALEMAGARESPTPRGCWWGGVLLKIMSPAFPEEHKPFACTDRSRCLDNCSKSTHMPKHGVLEVTRFGQTLAGRLSLKRFNEWQTAWVVQFAREGGGG